MVLALNESVVHEHLIFAEPKEVDGEPLNKESGKEFVNGF